jgi:hypothetical protein
MSEPLHVGCGSIASIPRCPRYVRLCSKSGDKADMETLRVRAKSCRERCRNGVRKKAGLLDHLVGERAQRHCALMFASLMTRPHLSISEPRKESNSSGVEPITTTVSRSSLSLTAGCARAATVSS